MIGRILSLFMLMQCLRPSPAAASAQFDKLDFYLHTVEVGDLIFNNFGHTAIRVVDRESGRDYIFNWGIFDFGQPVDFATRFYLGDLRYKLGIYPYSQSLARYKREQRTTWEDLLLLTNEEKAVLWQRLVWNAKPENRAYDYQYFFDNCSTRPRDYLDEAFQVPIKQLTDSKGSGHTFRDMVRSHYRTNPFIAMSLDILMNARLDREMSQWEKMFLPKSLRSSLLGLTRPTGEPLLKVHKTLVDFQAPQPLSFTGYQILWLLMLPFLVIPALGFIATWRLGGSLPWGVYRFLGGWYILYGLYTGLLGLLFPLNWTLSNHLDLHHNANMWLFWPLDLSLVVFGIALLKKGRGLYLTGVGATAFRAYCLAHLLAGACLVVLYGMGFIQQDVSLVLTYMLPVSVGLFWFGWRYGIEHCPE